MSSQAPFWGRIWSYLSLTFPDGPAEAADPVSGEPALPWVVFCSPEKRGRLGSSHCPGGPLDLQDRALACLGSPSGRCLGLSPWLFSGSAWAGTGRPRHSLTWAGVRLGSPAQRTSPELTQSRSRWKQVRGAPAQTLAGSPATAMLFAVAQSPGGCRSPPGHSDNSHAPGPGWERPGRGRLEAGLRLRLEGLPQVAQGFGRPQGKQGRGRGGRRGQGSGGPGRTSPAALT